MKSVNTCNDNKCPSHSGLSTKEEEHVGIIIKKDVNRTATIEWGRQHLVRKYERFEKRRSRLHVHNPACIDAAVGDIVRVKRTRPLSKTKHFVITKVLNGEIE
jgi:small subunit ribosomal protein S17